MLIDAMLTGPVVDAAGAAHDLEARGFDGIWVGETKHDPFLHVLQAARGAHRATLGTSLAIAFARSPMTLATTAYDLARYTEGRFVLGLGTQVKAHVERRFSMPWSQPARRMVEFVSALRSIWAAWENGSELGFRGEFYQHTLMTPMFRPGRHEWGPPPVYVAGVGPAMTEVAGAVGDGYVFHPLTTPEYLREVSLPAVARGRLGSSRSATEFAVMGTVFVVTGRDEREATAAAAKTRDRIAFYASTPAYRPVLDHLGRGDLQPELNRLSRAGRWSDMGDLIDTDLLGRFAVVAEPDQVALQLIERWSGAATRISLYTPYRLDEAVRGEIVAELRAAQR